MNAKEMLLSKMVPRFPDKATAELEAEIASMSWAERFRLYGEYCVQDALNPTITINSQSLNSGSSNKGFLFPWDRGSNP
jgi:hypothetical protein